ncbi:MAG: class I SAM-dependent methyltransferase [Acidobacteria bacterium]|nr:MAG: class I SAM-dependent methyltransferase [Acidobacteriota bacterium]REK01773.1 MAG: class I SAM-dependent methyltransferase [Acidobacteriota bacterium]REK14729.1 MAG: class I SAM-dependent methyltransferase [Acidobacteriota bacterium]REK45444.1 MAG: class I SAM-dependent methyltransferase [Acidobacteriota bacterium]
MHWIFKAIAGWIAFKILLLAVLWTLAFNGWQPFGSAKTATGPLATPTPSVDDSIDRETSDPYTGNLERFDRDDRAEKLQVQKVMDLLGIKEGSRVADIGAGSGWFTMIAADRVGADGRVFAVDISEESVKFINEKISREKRTNVETVLSKPEDPLLEASSIDAVLILNTYHEIAEPITFLRNLRKALKSKALVGIIERDGSGGNHGIDVEVVKREAARAGFETKEVHDFVKADKMDYFLIIVPASGN